MSLIQALHAAPTQVQRLTLGSSRRRACPGIHLAEKSLFIVISRTLWGFNITKKRRADGSAVEPTTTMQPGFLSVPHYFECDITCRSEKHRSVIESDFKKVDFDNLNYRG